MHLQNRVAIYWETCYRLQTQYWAKSICSLKYFPVEKHVARNALNKVLWVDLNFNLSHSVIIFTSVCNSGFDFIVLIRTTTEQFTWKLFCPFTHPHVIPKFYDFLCSLEYKRKFVECSWLHFHVNVFYANKKNGEFLCFKKPAKAP